MYGNKKLKKMNEITIRLNDKYFEKVNQLVGDAERAPILREIIEKFIDEQEFLTAYRELKLSEVRH